MIHVSAIAESIVAPPLLRLEFSHSLDPKPTLMVTTAGPYFWSPRRALASPRRSCSRKTAPRSRVAVIMVDYSNFAALGSKSLTNFAMPTDRAFVNWPSPLKMLVYILLEVRKYRPTKGFTPQLGKGKQT